MNFNKMKLFKKCFTLKKLNAFGENQDDFF